MLEIKRVEELLAAKESERSEILEQYRALSSDADRYQAALQMLENETSSMKMQLLTKETDLRRVREQLEQLEVELTDVRFHERSGFLSISIQLHCFAPSSPRSSVRCTCIVFYELSTYLLCTSILYLIVLIATTGAAEVRGAVEHSH